MKSFFFIANKDVVLMNTNGFSHFYHISNYCRKQLQNCLPDHYDDIHWMKVETIQQSNGNLVLDLQNLNALKCHGFAMYVKTNWRRERERKNSKKKHHLKIPSGLNSLSVLFHGCMFAFFVHSCATTLNSTQFMHAIHTHTQTFV